MSEDTTTRTETGDQHSGTTEATVEPVTVAQKLGLWSWIVEEWRNRPRPHLERQPSAAELYDYSLYGIWTTERAGAKRNAHLAYMRYFAKPIMVACDYIKYVVRAPERFTTVMVIVVVIAAGLLLLFLL